MVNPTSWVLIAAAPGEQRGVLPACLPTHSWCHHRSSGVLDNSEACSGAGIPFYWHLSAWAPGKLIAQREPGPGNPVRLSPRAGWQGVLGSPAELLGLAILAL